MSRHYSGPAEALLAVVEDGVLAGRRAGNRRLEANLDRVVDERDPAGDIGLAISHFRRAGETRPRVRGPRSSAAGPRASRCNAAPDDRRPAPRRARCARGPWRPRTRARRRRPRDRRCRGRCAGRSCSARGPGGGRPRRPGRSRSVPRGLAASGRRTRRTGARRRSRSRSSHACPRPAVRARGRSSAPRPCARRRRGTRSPRAAAHPARAGSNSGPCLRRRRAGAGRRCRCARSGRWHTAPRRAASRTRGLRRTSPRGCRVRRDSACARLPAPRGNAQTRARGIRARSWRGAGECRAPHTRGARPGSRPPTCSSRRRRPSST